MRAFTSNVSIPTCLLLLLTSNSAESFSIRTKHHYFKITRNDRLSLCASSVNDRYDEYLINGEIKRAIQLLLSSDGDEAGVTMTQDRFIQSLNAVEARTAEPEQNEFSVMQQQGSQFIPPVSEARRDLTDMYEALASKGYLNVFGASGKFQVDGTAIHPYPADGDANVMPPALLEKISGFPMENLTPKGSGNLFLIGGLALCTAEIFLSLFTGIDLDVFVGLTLLSFAIDKITVNGAVFETILKVLYPSYGAKILRHEAGHFLSAYLLGLPVEGCVLSAWAAQKDSRFKDQVTAGTSFFDPVLADDMNLRSTVTRPSIDRYSIVVMAGIAAEALNFEKAEGGAGDEMALTGFLSAINPNLGSNRGVSRATLWDYERIRNQARWGACQSVLLLKTYSKCYEALVDALERGGKLGECIYAIERAARDNDLGRLTKPIGVVEVVEDPNNQQSINWKVYDSNVFEDAVGEIQGENSIPEGVGFDEEDEEDSGTIMDRIEESKRKMRSRLEEIESELENL